MVKGLDGYWLVYEPVMVQTPGTPRACNVDMLNWPDERTDRSYVRAFQFGDVKTNKD